MAHVAAAHASLRLGETAAVRRWLDGAPPGLRGFEWRWLDARCDESLRSLLLEREPYAFDVDASGERVAVGSPDGGVAILDLTTGAELVRMAGHDGATFTVDFDPDGARLLSSSFDRTVKIWDSASGELLVEFTEHGYPVGGACFSGDGELVASSSYERDPVKVVVGTVHLWSSHTGEVLRTLEAGRKPIVDVRFSRDGRRLSAASWDFCVYVWDLLDESDARTLAMPDEGLYNAVDDVAFSPDGAHVAGVSKDGTARVWDAEAGELVLTLRGHDNDVTSVAFSPDGAVIATGSADQTVRLWDAADGSARGVLRGHVRRVDDVGFAPDGRLWSASPDGTLRVWDATVDWYGGVLRRTTDDCYAAAYSPDGERLATCSFDGRIQLWDSATWDQLASWQAHPQENSCHVLAWTPDGRRLLSGSYDQTVALWDAVTLEELGRLEHDGGLYGLALSPDGRTLATALSESVWIWDLERAEHVHTLDEGTSSTSDLAFSPDGRRLVGSNRDRSVRAWDVSSGELLQRLELDGEPKGLAFSPDGAVMALTIGAELRLLDGHSWEERARRGIGDNTVVRLAWSPDGTRLAGMSDHVPLVDPTAPALLITLRHQRESGWHLSWRPDGTQLATASMDGSLAITDAVPLRARLVRRAAALHLRQWALRHVDRELAGGRSLGEIVETARALAEQAEGGPEAAHDALLDAVTMRAAAGS